ncbi:hypothetical protein CCP3SC1AL1_4470004 [Gammaproteobacteria bacterium]
MKQLKSLSNQSTTMKTKTTTKKKQIQNALDVLTKHGVEIVTICDEELTMELYSDLWIKHKIEPTPENIEKVKLKAIDYLSCESVQCIQDAFENVAMKLERLK